MAITKQNKKDTIDALTAALKESGSAVFVNFHGLTVAEINAMRVKFREVGVTYKVARKTLIKRVLNDMGYTGEMPELNGELALAYSTDSLDPAREVYAFEKEYKGRVAIMGGVFDGAFKNKEEMTVIASIPGRQTLYAQFVNLIMSPIQGLVVGLNAIADKKEANA